MSQIGPIIGILQCPNCDKGPLAQRDDAIFCEGCRKEYPEVGGVHWFFRDAKAALWEWKARYTYYLQTLQSDIDELKSELRQTQLLKETEDRLKRLIQGKTEQIRSVKKLLHPLAVTEEGAPEIHAALRNKLPESQSLMGYYANVLRDWSFGEDENQICFATVKSLLPPRLGQFLCLGAGASRLPYDIHQAFAPTSTIVTDINPFLFYLAKRVVEGRNVNLYEFPMAPLDKASVAVAHKCSAPAEVKGNFVFLFADAMNPSFQPASIDTLLTPWLIDIVPQDFREFAKRLNVILKPGAVWVNFGSLAFFQKTQTLCYSPEEVLAILAESGFKPRQHCRQEIPYMHSSSSSQKRYESVFCFAAEKVHDVPKPPVFSFMPGWIGDTSQPVPFQEQLASIGLVNKTFAEIIATVDGKRSIKNIAETMGPKLGMKLEQAEALIKKFFANIYENGLKGSQF